MMSGTMMTTLENMVATTAMLRLLLRLPMAQPSGGVSSGVLPRCTLVVFNLCWTRKISLPLVTIAAHAGRTVWLVCHSSRCMSTGKQLSGAYEPCMYVRVKYFLPVVECGME